MLVVIAVDLTLGNMNSVNHGNDELDLRIIGSFARISSRILLYNNYSFTKLNECIKTPNQ